MIFKRRIFQNRSLSIFDCFEKQESILTDIEVDIVFSFVSDVGTKVSSNKTVPIAIVFTI